MANMKIRLKDNQEFVGSREYGKLQSTLKEVVHSVITGKIKPPKTITVDNSQKEEINFRLESRDVAELTRIAKLNRISVQELLREALIKSSLVVIKE